MEKIEGCHRCGNPSRIHFKEFVIPFALCLGCYRDLISVLHDVYHDMGIQYLTKCADRRKAVNELTTKFIAGEYDYLLDERR
uniref:Uncharacterized protein n=1 Tax=uncultured marine virus TaxID=186617 RepID=A0A0F7L3D0_9VIRU|nr:hypothetical protein [uncultured marine virus]